MPQSPRLALLFSSWLTSQSPSSIIAARPAVNRLQDCLLSMPMVRLQRSLVHFREFVKASVRKPRHCRPSSTSSASCFSALHFVSRMTSIRRMTCQLDRPAEGEGGNAGCLQLLSVGEKLFIGLRLFP